MAEQPNNLPPPQSGATPATGTAGGPPANIQQLVASKRLQQAQAQVGEVVDIMRVNVEKVLERDQKISELDRRADDLQEGASQFQQQAVKLKRKYWWENIKMWIVIGIVLTVIVIIVVVSTAGGENRSPESATEVVQLESGPNLEENPGSPGATEMAPLPSTQEPAGTAE